MQFHEESETAAEILRKAVPEMVRRGIPTTPVNFALWYASIVGEDEQLKDELERQFAEPGSHRYEVSDELFDRFVAAPRFPDVEKSREEAQAIVAEVLKSVVENVECSSSYDAALEEGISRLQSGGDSDDIQDTLTLLLSETRKAQEQNAGFQAKLEESQREIEVLRTKLEKTEQDAFTDPLTGIGNRRHFDMALGHCLDSGEETVSMLILDIDHFKSINDTYGHSTGDRVLQALAAALKQFETETVYVARFGGEEFAVVLPGQDIDGATKLGESIRSSIEALQPQSDSGQSFTVSASLGAAQRVPGEAAEQLLQRADAALYEAKEGGRNQVRAAA